MLENVPRSPIIFPFLVALLLKCLSQTHIRAKQINVVHLQFCPLCSITIRTKWGKLEEFAHPNNSKFMKFSTVNANRLWCFFIIYDTLWNERIIWKHSRPNVNGNLCGKKVIVKNRYKRMAGGYRWCEYCTNKNSIVKDWAKRKWNHNFHVVSHFVFHLFYNYSSVDIVFGMSSSDKKEIIGVQFTKGLYVGWFMRWMANIKRILFLCLQHDCTLCIVLNAY